MSTKNTASIDPQMYEYAVHLVDDYISREVLLDQSVNSANVYGEESFLQSLFSTDYSMVKIPAVFNEINHRLATCSLDKSRPYTMSVARLKSTYVDMCAVLGVEFVDVITSRIIDAYTKLDNTSERKTTRARYTDFFDRWPFIILCVIGNKVYSKSRVIAQRSQIRSV